MPSLKLVDTSLVPRCARRPSWASRILAWLAIGLLFAGFAAPAEAQKKPRGKHARHAPAEQGAEPAPEEGTLTPPVPDGGSTVEPKEAGPKEAKPAKGAHMPKGAKGARAAKSAAAAAPPTEPKASIAPTVVAPQTPPEKPAEAWTRILRALTPEYFARHPEAALERPWPGIPEPKLGTFGAAATLRWRKALGSAFADLARIETRSLPKLALAQLDALRDWLEAEILRLDVESPSTSDPAAYVERAFRTLRAARDAEWMPIEKRQEKLASLLDELPAYFDDARVGLVDPATQWIDLALSDLDDLQELVVDVQGELPAAGAANKVKKAKKGGADVDPCLALEDFRERLLELRSNSGGWPQGLDASGWERLARLRCGTPWTIGEIKARCLRELGWMELDARPGRDANAAPAEEGELLAQAWDASTRALELGRSAHLLGGKIAPGDIEFALATSPRTHSEMAWLTPGGASSMRVLLARPHGSWPIERTLTHERGLESGREALGIRYGLAGEALFALQSRARRGAPPMLLDNRLVRGGFGLLALDWTSRVDWHENPFRTDAELAREAGFQRGLEAARLVAALELHAQGVSLQEAAHGFQRRTGVDPDTAWAEALAALRDPEHGLGYLGLLELRGLEERTSKVTKAREGIGLALMLVQRLPELRPSDMDTSEARAPTAAASRKGKKTTALEKTAGQPQQGEPRSR